MNILTILRADSTVESFTFDALPSLEVLQKAVGGYIEVIPYFVKYKGEDCIALCNEEGKLNDLPLNTGANLLWFSQRPRPPLTDVLVGDVAIITGDNLGDF